jgi:CheY-like chemotaxis protein
MRILLVDDDLSIRTALAEILEDEGYHVVGAANGQEALRYLQQQKDAPCLILLDLMMPIMNGWDFRREQQQDPQLASIPVVVISADNSVPQKAASLAATGYLQKPIDLERLIATVSQYCG